MRERRSEQEREGMALARYAAPEDAGATLKASLGGRSASRLAAAFDMSIKGRQPVD
jgi:hypothetical protein